MWEGAEPLGRMSSDHNLSPDLLRPEPAEPGRGGGGGANVAARYVDARCAEVGARGREGGGAGRGGGGGVSQRPFKGVRAGILQYHLEQGLEGLGFRV